MQTILLRKWVLSISLFLGTFLPVSAQTVINASEYGLSQDTDAAPAINNALRECLACCSACPVPEIANVFNPTGVKFHQITGMLHDDETEAHSLILTVTQ